MRFDLEWEMLKLDSEILELRRRGLEAKYGAPASDGASRDPRRKLAHFRRTFGDERTQFAKLAERWPIPMMQSWLAAKRAAGETITAAEQEYLRTVRSGRRERR